MVIKLTNGKVSARLQDVIETFSFLRDSDAALDLNVANPRRRISILRLIGEEVSLMIEHLANGTAREKLPF